MGRGGVGWSGHGLETIDAAWICMVCIKKLHSQHFVLTKPRFTALCEVLAMEVCKPQCQLTEEYHRSFETYLLTEKVLFFGVHKNPPMKMSCYCGQTRKHPNFGIHYLDVFDERNSHFTTVPYSCLREKKRAFTSTVSGPAGCWVGLVYSVSNIWI